MIEPTPVEALGSVIEATADTLMTAIAAWFMMQGQTPTIEGCRGKAIEAMDGIVLRTKVEGARW